MTDQLISSLPDESEAETVNKTDDGEYNSGNDIDQNTSTAATDSESNQVAENKCRGDDAVRCKDHPHIQICEVQLCDGIEHCPNGTDEENCQTGFYLFFFIFIILLSFYWFF